MWINLEPDVAQTILKALEFRRNFLDHEQEELEADNPRYERYGERVAKIDIARAALDSAQGQCYSHRNGETEPPIDIGWYWFCGVVAGQGRYEGSATVMRTIAGNLYCIGSEETYSHDLADWVGQWYGPVVPPWEQRQSPAGAEGKMGDR